jgi:hypothetical protein
MPPTPPLGADGVALNLGYGRASNATWAAFEAAVGALEGGQRCASPPAWRRSRRPSPCCRRAARWWLPCTPYNTSGALIGEVEAAGREVRRVDVQDTAAVVAALDGADAIWLESPTNPLMEVADLPVIIAAARERGVVVVCDNTFATPLLQQPLTLGADIVVHSATKYLSGPLRPAPRGHRHPRQHRRRDTRPLVCRAARPPHPAWGDRRAGRGVARAARHTHPACAAGARLVPTRPSSPGGSASTPA